MKKMLPALAVIFLCSSCQKFFDKNFWKDHDYNPGKKENPASFAEIGTIDVGDVGAAEITAFDPKTARLFVVNNSGLNRIDVVDLTDPTAMSLIGTIYLEKYNGAVNSVAVHNGLLAAAIEANDKQQPGKVVVFKTTDYSEIKVITVGALPDMVTFSPNGKYILTANEGEPNGDYDNDPEGTVSIIEVDKNFSMSTLNFSGFDNKKEWLMKNGLRVFGPNASFAQDMEPEYIAVSDDSKTAWVTLQENNAIAKIDLRTKRITDIFPLGFKDYSKSFNAIDPSDRDNSISFRSVPVYGIYMPDAIAFLEKDHTPYLFTVNEGDAREYDAFAEVARISSISLDPAVFPNAAELQDPAKLGRLNITTTLGDPDKDGLFEALYSLGARSFSVWNGNTGKQLYDSRNNLEKVTVDAGYYDDGRSDDKGVEPEGIAIGEVGGRKVAFVGMERADAVAIYDVTNPVAPRFLKILQTGDAPEGILFISAKDSPIKRSILVVSSEEDGVIKVYTPLE